MQGVPSTKQLFKVDDVAKRLNLHVKTVRRFIREGRLPAKRIGKEYRVTRSALEEFAGAPFDANEAPSPSRTRQVLVSSIVDVDAISAEDGQRITTLIMAGLNARRGEPDFPRVDSFYDADRGRLRIMITANPTLACDLVRTIATLAEANRE
ncbi:MAG TPA: helix-turn-helix domain-containing protein [Vicinamibacterales bacterium]|nr:helix-turn-helix domain-containing protein [Vicinamibacterales bacterium]